MKKAITKIFAVLLAVTAMFTFVTLNVNAAEERSYKYTSIKDTELNTELMGYLHYFYDSSNPSRVTKTYAVSDFVSSQAAALTSSSVYVFTMITITFTNGNSVTYYSRSQPFFISNGIIHHGDAMMASYPYVHSSAYAITTIIAQHALCTYNSSAHTGDYHDDGFFNVEYPMAGERVIYSGTTSYLG